MTIASTTTAVPAWAGALHQCLWTLVGLWWFAAGSTCAQGQAVSSQQPAPGTLRVYLIGNSLTWDCVPAALGVDAQWHVDCGKNLKQIFDAPQKPCVPSSTVWTKALNENQYDIVCIQPHYGTNLAEDIELVSQWMAMQPKAVLVLHAGWPKHVDRLKEFERTDSSTPTSPSDAGKVRPMTMHHSVKYMEELAQGVAARHPGIQIRQTHIMEALQQIGLDIQTGNAPLKNVSELYRDEIHLTFAGGRYLAHNMLRQSLGLPRSSQGFQLDDELKMYLDRILTRFSEVH